MKIAILGNMNNNGFSLMRHLRDLGEEADLLLFEDDGTGPSSHFSIKTDTWDYKKWQPFIKTLPAVNSYGQALSKDSIYRIVLYMVYLLRLLLLSKNALLTKPAKTKDIQALINFGDINDIEMNVLKGAWKTNLKVRPEKDWEKLKGRAVSD